MKQTDKEIERLVDKYPWPDSKELFRTELQYLVGIAEREQIKEDMETAKKVLNH